MVEYYCGRKSEEKRIKKEEEKIGFEKIACEAIKECNNLTQTCRMLGKRPSEFNYNKLNEIIKKYNVDTSHFHTEKNNTHINRFSNINEVFCENSHADRKCVRNWIKKYELKEMKCEKCGRIEWEGKPIPLEIHHINGIKNDNRLENIQVLCCNCHAQTENFKAKNKTKINKVQSICAYCGSKFDFNGKKFCCLECRRKYFENKFKETSKCPTKEILINDYKELKTLRNISKKYGVSDKCIAKWFKRYSLPYKIKEINNYLFNNGNDI